MANIKLFFAGDFCSLPPANDIVVESELASLISEADISVCNFETPVLPPNYKKPQDPLYPHLFQSRESAMFIENLGFNVLSFANNHTFDCGDEGYYETLKQFKKCKLIGAGRYDEAYRVTVLERKGLRIGFLALTYASFGVFDAIGSTQGFGCAYINHPCVNNIISESKKMVDVLIVLAHDGIEYTDAPTHRVRDRYRELTECGADAVVACHPHCPQGWEVYKGRPIFYSLGNFFFNSKRDPSFRTTLPYWYNGLALILNIDIKTKKIGFDVVNTIAEGRTIIIDRSESTLSRNSCLCSLIANENEFEKYWDSVIPQLYTQKYIPFCEQTFGPPRRQRGIKGAVKWLMNLLASRKAANYKRFLFIVRSDTERDLFLRGMRRANGFI